MMHSTSRGRWLAASALAAGIAATAISVAAPAAAEPTRYLALYPSAGDFGDPLNVHVPTGAYCPPEADRAIIRMTGPGLEKPFNLIGNSRLTSFNTLSIPGTTIIPLLWTWYDAQGYVEPAPIRFDGTYRITLQCLQGLSLESIGDSVADVTIDQESMTYRVESPQPAQPAVPEMPADGGGPDAEPPQDAGNGGADEGLNRAANEGSAAGAAGGNDGGASTLQGDVSPAPGADGADPSPAAEPQPGAAEPDPEAPAAGEGTANAPAVQAASDRDTGLDSRTLLIVGGAVLLTGAVFTATRNRKRAAQP